MKTNPLKKITLSALVIMSIEKKRNLGLKNIVEGVKIEPFKLGNKLETKEINQMVNSRVFFDN